MNNNNTSSGGIGFLGVLAIVFIVLKLCNVIDWAWGWALSPLWIPIAIWALVAAGSLAWVALFSTKEQKEQMKRIIEDQNKNAGKSKWQQRMEDMQEAQKKAAELKTQRGY